jgi:hypothetical protein
MATGWALAGVASGLVRFGPDVPPGLHLSGLGLLFGKHLTGELTNLGQAAVLHFGGGQLDAGAGASRHELGEGLVKVVPAEP